MKYRFTFTRSDDAECRALTYMHVFGERGPIGTVALRDECIPPAALAQLVNDLAFAAKFKSACE